MFQFQNTISVSDMLSLFFLSLAIVGFFLTRHQIKQGYDVQKASFFKELFQTMYGDPDIRNTLYLILHGKFVFDDTTFYELGHEQSIDRLLCYLDLICALYQVKMLTKQEMVYFEFELNIVYQDPHIQAYLQHVKVLYRKRGIAISPFSSFLLYCEKEYGMIKREEIKVATRTTSEQHG